MSSTCCLHWSAVLLQGNVNEVVAASVVHMNQVPVDKPCTSWNNPRHLRHFSVLRKLDNQPFPTGVCASVLSKGACHLP